MNKPPKEFRRGSDPPDGGQEVDRVIGGRHRDDPAGELEGFFDSPDLPHVDHPRRNPESQGFDRGRPLQSAASVEAISRSCRERRRPRSDRQFDLRFNQVFGQGMSMAAQEREGSVCLARNQGICDHRLRGSAFHLWTVSSRDRSLV